METINFSQLPNIPSTQITSATELALNTTDANGVSYVGKTTLGQLLGDGEAGCTCVHTAVLTLSSAEILALNTTPIQFGLNVPAGYYAVPLNLVGVLNYGTVTFDTHADIAIRAVGATRNFGRVIGLLTATANTAGQWSMTGANAGDLQYVTGADIEAFSAADGTVGDSTVTLYLTYVLIQA